MSNRDRDLRSGTRTVARWYPAADEARRNRTPRAGSVASRADIGVAPRLARNVSRPDNLLRSLHFRSAARFASVAGCGPSPSSHRGCVRTLDAAVAGEAKTSIERMLHHQMATAHVHAMKCFEMSMGFNLPGNGLPTVEQSTASKCRG